MNNDSPSNDSVIKYWGYRPVRRKYPDVVLNGEMFPGEEYLILEEVHYENHIPVASDGGRHFRVDFESGAAGMIELLKTAIRHIEERGILEAPWIDTK